MGCSPPPSVSVYLRWKLQEPATFVSTRLHALLRKIHQSLVRRVWVTLTGISPDIACTVQCVIFILDMDSEMGLLSTMLFNDLCIRSQKASVLLIKKCASNREVRHRSLLLLGPQKSQSKLLILNRRPISESS